MLLSERQVQVTLGHGDIRPRMLSKTLTGSVVLAQPGSVVMISMAHIATKGHKTTHPPRPLDYYLWLESEEMSLVVPCQPQ